MRQLISEIIEVPSGVNCTVKDQVIICSKSGVELSKSFNEPSLSIALKNNQITIEIKKGNKKDLKLAKSIVAHIENMFNGLESEYEYQMEACNVHFPMTLKIDKSKLIITNFLGEKKTREAVIIPGVTVEIKGQKLTVKSRSKDNAGQTVANIEKATKIRKRDRRIFQDGIYLTNRPGETQWKENL